MITKMSQVMKMFFKKIVQYKILIVQKKRKKPINKFKNFYKNNKKTNKRKSDLENKWIYKKILSDMLMREKVYGL